MTTIGVDTKTVYLEVLGQIIRIIVWDTQGQESHYALTKSYFQPLDACILAFDLTRAATFENVEQWKQDLNQIKDIPVIMVANKADLEHKREIGAADLEEKSEEMGIKTVETSAESG